MSSSMRAAALFLSHLQPSDTPDQICIEAAVRAALATHGGPAGCAAAVAAEYGDHPETAATRMRWARALGDATHAVAA